VKIMISILENLDTLSTINIIVYTIIIVMSLTYIVLEILYKLSKKYNIILIFIFIITLTTGLASMLGISILSIDIEMTKNELSHKIKKLGYNNYLIIEKISNLEKSISESKLIQKHENEKNTPNKKTVDSKKNDGK